MTRPSVAPLMAAWSALRASENAERHGRLDEALKQAQEAIKHAEEWRDQLFGPDVCTHDVPLDRDCAKCHKLTLAQPEKGV